MTSRTLTSDPCRIGDSDSEDDPFPLPKNVPITVRLGTPQISQRRMTPKINDWQIKIEDEDQFSNNAPVDPPRRTTGGRLNGTLKSNNSKTRIPSATPSSSSSGSGRNDQPNIVVNNDDSQSASAPLSTPAAGTTTTTTTTDCDFDPYALIQEDLLQFIHTPIPEDYSGFIQCRLRRDTAGVQGNFFPTFYLQAERPNDGKKVFLLAARRIGKVNRLAEYSITTNVESISRASRADGYVGKLRGNNLSGTEYTLYGDGLSPNKISKKKRSENQENLRRELAAIVYDKNIFGFKGPRQIHVVLPKLGEAIQPTNEDQTILSQWRHRRLNYLIQLRNKSPKYNEATKTYVIQFIGNRVVKPSVKNFQIIVEEENHEETVVMQFGRVDRDVFTCDFRYPLSAIQAFSIALSSFDSRIVRE